MNTTKEHFPSPMTRIKPCSIRKLAQSCLRHTGFAKEGGCLRATQKAKATSALSIKHHDGVDERGNQHLRDNQRFAGMVEELQGVPISILRSQPTTPPDNYCPRNSSSSGPVVLRYTDAPPEHWMPKVASR